MSVRILLICTTLLSCKPKETESIDDTDREIQPDSDGDGVPDTDDAFPDNPNESVDADDDGFGANSDCNDTDPDINPTAEEIWYDDVDQNCDTLSDFDQDQDGFDSMLHGGSDCDDTNENLSSTMYDFDCDGTLDVSELCHDGIDNDANGFLDCEDSDCFTNPLCFENCSDGVDNEGDGLTDCNDDECWGTGSCTSGYTLIQQAGSYHEQIRISGIQFFSYHISESVSITDFEGLLRIPTGPNSFLQCSWTVDTASHTFRRNSFENFWYGSSDYNSSIVVQITETPLQRSNFVLQNSCPFTSSSIQTLFLGTELRTRFETFTSPSSSAYITPNLWNPVQSQWISWYQPGTFTASRAVQQSEVVNIITGSISPTHKLDIDTQVYDMDADGVMVYEDCDDDDPTVGLPPCP